MFSWYKYLIVNLVFPTSVFVESFFIAPFPDRCLLVPFHNNVASYDCFQNYLHVLTVLIYNMHLDIYVVRAKGIMFFVVVFFFLISADNDFPILSNKITNFVVWLDSNLISWYSLFSFHTHMYVSVNCIPPEIYSD